MDKVPILVAAGSSLFLISYCGAMRLLERYSSERYLTPEWAATLFAVLFTLIIFRLIRMYYSDKFCKCGKKKSCGGCSHRVPDDFDENE